MSDDDPFHLFALLRAFSIAADGLATEFVLAALGGGRLRPLCHIPTEILEMGLSAAAGTRVSLPSSLFRKEEP